MLRIKEVDNMKSYTEDCLVVSFDLNFNKDIATLMVARKDGETLRILNSFHNDEAIDLYCKLIRRD